MDEQSTWTLAEFFERDLQELAAVLRGVRPQDHEHLGKVLLNSHRVFLVAQGRSGLAARMFAMRLMQLGYQAHVVGEVTTPGIGPGDLLIAVSGSGETPSVVESARRAKNIGASLAVVTVAPNSTLAGLADHVTVIPGETTKLAHQISSRLPLASVLEQAMVLYFDCLVAWLAEQIGQDNGSMMARHANLE